MNLKGPDRRTYYDMDPWYEKNISNGINDWHQHVKDADEKLLTYIKNFINKNSPLNVLEVGCGGGDFTLSYASEKFKHDAFEFSGVAIGAAKKKDNPVNVNFYEGDALNVESYRNKPYDLVIMKDVLHCILGADRMKLLKHLRESINENGTVILTTHSGLPKSEEVLQYIDQNTRENHIQTRVYLDRAIIKKEFDSTGFKIQNLIELAGQLDLFELRRI